MKSDELKVVVTEADYKKGKKQFQMIGIGIVVIGLLIASYTLVGILGSTKTLAKVISIEKSYSTSGSGTDRRQWVSYTPTLSFVDDIGETHQAPSNNSDSVYNYPIGEEVNIYYDSDDFSSVRINRFLSLWKLPLIFWAVGGFLVWLTTKMNTSVENTRIEKGYVPSQTLFAEQNEVSQINEKFNSGKKVADEITGLSENSEPAKNKVELPKGLAIDFQEDYMHITSRWFDFRIIGVFLGAIMFNGLSIFQGFWPVLMSDKEWETKLFPLIFIIIGFVATYITLAKWLNKTHIYTSKKAIEIKQRPLPWLGNMRLDTENIKQLFTKLNTKKDSKGNSLNTYEIHIITTDNKEIKLVSGLGKKEQAWFIENNIEKYLGIEDVTVRGEIEK